MIHINRPNNPWFLVRVRRPGYRNYEVKGRYRSHAKAVSKLGKVFADKQWKRGDVLMATYDYYDPAILERIQR